MVLIVIAEKGSVARDIRFKVNAPLVTIDLRGHLLELDFPAEYRRWDKVEPKRLFDAKVDWAIRDEKAYKELTSTLSQYENPTLVLATDNDHEGELIAYEVLIVARKILGENLRFKRMRFNSTVREELLKAWNSLEDDLKWSWVWKAYFRHKFDLITGAIYTRLLTLSARKAGGNVKLLSWGSCQTPTLWFILKREKEIRGFKPEIYYVIEAEVNVKGVKVKFSSKPVKEENEALKLYSKVKNIDKATVTGFELNVEAERKPYPTETDRMLQELTKITGLSSARIMSEAEELYAEGYISYPRTQTNQWTKIDHKKILDMLSRSFLIEYLENRRINPRSGSRNDGAHPPIYPTKVYWGENVKRKIWEYIARRYLANVVYDDARLIRWRLNIDVEGVKLDSKGRYFVDEGFYKVFPYFKPKETFRIPEVKQGEVLPVERVKLSRRKTKPPPRLSEAELLRLMEEYGIGTDATRHEFPNLILNRGYAVKKGKTFMLTELGETLLELLSKVDGSLITPETRRLVEETMIRVEKGEISSEEALNETLKIYQRLYFKLEEKTGIIGENLAKSLNKSSNS
jgi:DNA topoisomerase IA